MKKGIVIDNLKLPLLNKQLMRNLILALFSSLLIISCGKKVTCSDPGIMLDYILDSTHKLAFTFHTYQKGSGFSKLISSEPDTAYLDNTNTPNYVNARHLYIGEAYDYTIEIPATGKTYKVSNISYSGHDKVRVGGFSGDGSDACTRTVSYTLNGQNYTVNGDIYKSGKNGPIIAKIPIIK